MAEKRSSNTTTRKRTTSKGGGSRKTTGSSSRSTSPRGGSRAQASRTSTSSRNYGRTSNYTARKRREEERDEMRRDILLVVLFAGMVFLFLANWGLFGIVGHMCKNIMFGAVGAAAYVLPLVIFALILYGMMNGDDEDAGARIACVIIMYVLIAMVCDLMSGQVDAQGTLDLAGIYSRCTENSAGGGILGGVLAWILMRTIGLVGTVLLLIVIAVICLVVLTGKPLLRLMQDQAVDARDRMRYRREAEAAYREEHPEEYDEGFLPDDEDDELTEEDIADYRARRAQMERDRREQRQERLREEARRDVARRHETRNQAFKTFKGIVGDTNLMNDPYIRQMSENAARAAAMQEADTGAEAADAVRADMATPDETAADVAPDRTVQQTVVAEETPAVSAALTQTGAMDAQMPLSANAGENDTYMPVGDSNGAFVKADVTTGREFTTTATHADTSRDDAMNTPAVTAADVPVNKETDNASAAGKESAGHSMMSWWRSRGENRKESVQAPDVADAATDAAAVATGAAAAQQLLRNQRPGTDGIRLTVITDRDRDDADSYEDDHRNDTDTARESVRKAIPIYRESNNMHEINALEFQGSYAALARNTMQSDTDDEDLTSRIIREGMAELDRDENQTPEYGMGDAQSAAANAFRKSHAFTETQDAYKHSVPQNAATDTEMPVAALAAAQEPAPDTAVPTTQLERDPGYGETVMPDPALYVEDSNTEVVTDPDTEQAVAQETVPDAEDNVTALDLDTEETVELEPASYEEDPAAQESVPAAIPASPVQEMTTPVGSGSALAAAHAKTALIHTEDKVAGQAQAAASASEAAPAVPVKQPREYVYPPLSLLTPGNPSRDSGSDEELRHTAEVLETTLHTFGVNCKITDISQGPAVTRYELLPEQGVKVSKVVGLSDDIKLALAAMDIRIEAPIPGKSAIGIEVPNKVTSMVALRDILAHPNFRDHKSKLAFGVGKDISGQIVVSDLAKMPHVLIAGATGSGKSVCINTIIMSILYHAKPDEVKLLMIDPKVVELSVYNGIPHLLYPVVTNPQQASTLLNWAVAEMEARFGRFADARVRDMNGYNEMILEHLGRGETVDPEGNAYRIMPRLVVIVDELADLMMVAKNDVETAICRLAQLARAAGIHLIIATQRPSVDVITGLIKANMPSRIAFAVSSGVDSRTILDMNGAEKLLGKGDMLFFQQGFPKPVRIQGAFVTDDEVSAVVEFIREQDPADSEEEARIRQQMENLGNGGQIGSGDARAQDSANNIDDYFYRAGKFIIEKDNASIGLLQRGFRIGFNRAARLMDQLCDAGVVAESEGTKSRKILMTQAEFEAYCEENDLR